MSAPTATAVSSSSKDIIFIQSESPPLPAGTYALTATQSIPNQTDSNLFNAAATFIVNPQRFTLAPHAIQSVFPPNLADGPFTGVLPHVVFRRRTLPWERSLNSAGDGGPWLAVLVLDDAMKPPPP